MKTHILSPNKLSNNSTKRKTTPSTPFHKDQSYHIQDVEISISPKCQLSCDGCGFHVPHQISPFSNNDIQEHLDALEHLKSLGLIIHKVVVVGGEATLNPELPNIIHKLKSNQYAQQIELVTNGLYPRGITQEILESLDSLVISDYVRTPEYEDAWTHRVKSIAPTLNLTFRRADSWDDWNTPVKMDSAQTLHAYKHCFYRKYDVTIERGRLFSCSRLAKKKLEDQGVVISTLNNISEVEAYLNNPNPHQACSECSPCAGLPPAPVAKQPDNRLQKLTVHALNQLQAQINQGI